LAQSAIKRERKIMSDTIELELQQFPKTVALKDGNQATLRPLHQADEQDFHQLFLGIPEAERLFIKHRVMDRSVIHDWCQNIDYGHNLPLLALMGGKIVGDATLHQQLGGWKRHVGRVSVLVHPEFRGRGLARALIGEIIEIARNAGLERVEAEFIGEQAGAMKMFALLGFSQIVRLDDYVEDMQAIKHDYILMGLELKTDEEFASAAG
jgi:GNAT superfamily N-acetyltransferase